MLKCVSILNYTARRWIKICFSYYKDDGQINDGRRNFITSKVPRKYPEEDLKFTQTISLSHSFLKFPPSEEYWRILTWTQLTVYSSLMSYFCPFNKKQHRPAIRFCFSSKRHCQYLSSDVTSDGDVITTIYMHSYAKHSLQ